MVKQSDGLSDLFFALAHPVRRETLDTLGDGMARSASDLAAPHGMSLPGFMKHLGVLSEAGLVTCAKQGRTVSCALNAGALSPVSDWLGHRERTWHARLDALGRHLYHREQIEAAAAARTTRRKPP